MGSTQTISTGYVPRRHQAYLHRNLRRFNVVLCHRRFGKTIFAINELLDRALRNMFRNPQYAYIAPTYSQAKKIAWEALKEYTKMLPGVSYHETELRCTIERPGLGDKITIHLLGAENPDTLRGIYLDGVIMDEYADMAPDIWTKVVRQALSDRGGWAIFIGTPKGQNHFYELYQYAHRGNPEAGDVAAPLDWYCATFKASETEVIPIAELESARAVMAPEEYEQEYECSFSAALVGAYYGREIERAEKASRITAVPYEPALPVITAWDLGVDDATVIWLVQVHGKQVRVIGYIEESGAGLDYYVKELNKLDYMFAEHLLPHDVKVRELGASGAASRLETLKSLGLKNITVVPKVPVADGINAARLLLARCWFDAIACHRGIKALKSYERKWDSKNKVFQQAPLHNWASHGADGFRTLAVGLDENAMPEEVRKNLPRTSNMDYSVV